MFTGIIETLGVVTKTEIEAGNIHLTLQSNFTNELKIDQSVAHNGVCLTVIDIKGDEYTVTAIKETLDKTNIGGLLVGDEVNLERAMKLGDRLDGHIVQGHVDETGSCIAVKNENGSTIYSFAYNSMNNNVTIEKGSITINGVSLTVVNSKVNEFSVAIIPYTLTHTTFKNIKKGDEVNLEFDVIGKYVSRLTQIKEE
ncbi:riboflavin synthase [Tenacibaculum maritimum]|uniref:riboflavin synthase n=1 Tax=Tenacibaculum maritimum TaxID=107401 RepID=UPI0012E57742|nr:riboflavin synthase [Tenacibaculum maritimum]MCD9580818.1 riboflavin synthase [Tenacibaculum maritimum]MCD9635092.1 riboflavin synthase [Tenacibaculum maritimum]MDB0600509.1 riboflavin synthase [Tenacibaculum maritimum]MDB0610662.1 riboflavin synthase [Tenacibaculum maritimum]CAA0183843.1 riboflavin synthase, alpha subunit [Tenacibaculum maritimum]